MHPPIEIKQSADGSTTLYRPDMQEHYHSVHGAITESMHVFIGAGLWECRQSELNILEVGFGSGLNTVLTLVHAAKRRISYHALELYPLLRHITDQINYPQMIAHDRAPDFFNRIHRAPWDKPCRITPTFELVKRKQNLLTYRPDRLYDLIYFDAFDPAKQPELWKPAIFKMLGNATKKSGILVTYSAKGSVKRALIDAGFDVEKIPGPPGKREMIRGRKQEPPPTPPAKAGRPVPISYREVLQKRG